MKAFLTAAVALMIAVSASGAKPALTETQVSEIGKLILGQTTYPKYRKLLSTKKPVDDPEEKLWRLTWTPRSGDNFPGAGVFFFELRDADAHFQIGEATNE